MTTSIPHDSRFGKRFRSARTELMQDYQQQPIHIISMFPMQYDKFTCSLPLATLSKLAMDNCFLGDDIYDHMAQLLSRAYGDIQTQHYNTQAKTVAYFNKGQHLLSLSRTNLSPNLLLGLYGVNSWEMSRWVLKELGDLKATWIDVCFDYTGPWAWDVGAYKIELVANKRAIATCVDAMRTRTVFAHTASKHQPVGMYALLNNSTRITVYEKGRKMMNDIHALSPNHPVIATIDPTWTRIELQSWNMHKLLSEISELPVVTWMDMRGEQWMMDRLFLRECELMHGGWEPKDGDETWPHNWVKFAREQLGINLLDGITLDKWIGIKLASRGDHMEMQLWRDVYYQLKDASLRATT